MAYTAADVKKLREETDAPMMECKTALDEAGGDFERAKAILREKGKVAAAKRADRSTAEGVVALSSSPDCKVVGAVVLECETDFVARNEDFIAMAQQLADIFRDNDPGEDPVAVTVDGQTVGGIVEAAVAKIRENIQLRRAVRLTSENTLATYVHHNNKKGSVAEVSGSASNLGEIGRSIAIQAVAFPPKFIRKDEVPQDVIDREMEIETQRAINEGKTPEIAANIAKGRINKEFYKTAVLLEQGFYVDPNQTVADFVKSKSKEGGGDAQVKSITLLSVGESA